MSLILSQIECMKMKTKSGRLCLQYLLTRRVTVWSALVILLGTVVLVANICLVYNIRSGWALHSNRHEERSQQQSPPSPTLWIYHKTVSLALVHLNIEAKGNKLDSLSSLLSLFIHQSGSYVGSCDHSVQSVGLHHGGAGGTLGRHVVT